MTGSFVAQEAGLIQSQVSNMVTGYRPTSVAKIDRVADVLDLTQPEREEMHLAAALDQGFQLPIVPPPKRRKMR